MEYDNVHRHSLISVLQFKRSIHITEVKFKSVLFTSICGLKILNCRKDDAGYSWNFLALVSFLSLSALQGLHQPRKKVKSVYWKVISILLKYFQEKTSHSSNVDSFMSGHPQIQSYKKPYQILKLSLQMKHNWTGTHHSIASSSPVPLVAEVLNICHFRSFKAGRPRAFAISVGVMACSMSCLFANTTKMAFFSSSS